ncbi:MAG: hypothetical protein KF905_05945 [Flavobacteriales bacterium]|nr:hypothetical protein [Flavobacteriales bacterium]
MSITFLFLVPTVVGFLTVHFSRRERVQRITYSILAPWLPICLFMLITLGFSIEGWACWLMVLPLFLVAASIGGLLARRFKLRTTSERLQLSIAVLIPFMIGPLESFIGTIPGTYEARTSIDIHAPAELIWMNVTRVKLIPEELDSGHLTRLLGFPRPLRAELDTLAVGGYREAVFTNGLVFHETVSDYIHEERMVFHIEARPHEIPSTTLDEHVVVGGNYFDVLQGTYELEQLGEQKFRLHLYSTFEMNTTFNFYASWWARWIMKDIQNNILRVQKIRSEGQPA